MPDQREEFPVSHFLFAVDGGPMTFGLYAAEPEGSKNRRPLVTGFIERGMGDQLRRLADRVEEIEAGLE